MGSGYRGPRHPAGKQSTRRLTLSAALQAGGRGEPSAALRHPQVISAHIMGSPARRLLNPITRCRDQPQTAMQGQTTDEAPAKRLTQNDSR